MPKDSKTSSEFRQGTYAYDHRFLSKFDSLIILQNNNGLSRIIISPKYQGKVFTSTAEGDEGRSFGWINYKAFTDSVNPHMNAYGGENRLWLGPEGGPYSLYFSKGSEMIFDNWKVPALIDTEPWTVSLVWDCRRIPCSARVKDFAAPDGSLRNALLVPGDGQPFSLA